MIDKQQILKAVEYIKKNCIADDFTFSVYNSNNHLTRFAQNGITQHINGNKLNVRLEVAFDNKTGVASGNNLDENSLKQKQNYYDL